MSEPGTPTHSGSSTATEPTRADGLQDLLRLAQADSLQELSDQVTEYADYDAWIPSLDQQPGELLIRVARYGVTLTYPFSLADLWEAVDDLEADAESAHDGEDT